jgi:hypothetical protein
MGSGRKRALPLIADLLGKGSGGDKPAPSVDAARLRLGGRAAPATADVGRIVSLDGGHGLKLVGIVLYGTDTDLDVWIEGGVVRRTKPELVEDFRGVVHDDFLAMARDARAFARLREMQAVRYERSPGTIERAALVEKCRYGALVLREDGKLMAVGFRKVWAVQPDVDAPN